MVDFVDAPPFLRIVLWVAMETMHFHIAKLSFRQMFFFRIQGGPNENLAPMRTCPGDWGSCWSN